MSISPDIAADLAFPVSEYYTEAERILIERIAKRLAVGIDGPLWAQQKLAAVGAFQRDTRALLAALTPQVRASILAAMGEAWTLGSDAAVAEMVGKIAPLSGTKAVAALAKEASTLCTSTHLRILRSSVDTYRQVVAKVSAQTLLGTLTRRESAQSALDMFARRGITGFVDKTGRNWQLDSYVEMAVRSTTAHAAVQAHTESLIDNGFDLVVISNAPQECERCRPAEGKVFSLSGDSKDHPPLSDAISKGLFHPGCRHSQSLWQPGITKAPTNTADPQGDADRQKLRYLERQVRASKRVQAAAMDPAAARKAGVQVRERQAAIRDHVATSSAKRIPAREGIKNAR